jgi:hypothetical protein
MTRSPALITGFVLCTLLGVLDIVGLAGFGMDNAPPAAVIITGAVLGIVTVAAAVPAWRGSRRAIIAMIVSRVLSALLAIPAFVVADVPAWGKGIAAGSIVLTAIGVALLAPAARTPRGLHA